MASIIRMNIESGSDFVPDGHQALTWINADLLLTKPIFGGLKSKYEHFLLRGWIKKCRLQNVVHFIQASFYLTPVFVPTARVSWPTLSRYILPTIRRRYGNLRNRRQEIGISFWNSVQGSYDLVIASWILLNPLNKWVIFVSKYYFIF